MGRHLPSAATVRVQQRTGHRRVLRVELRILYFLFQSRRALVEYHEELVGQLLKHLERDVRIDVRVPRTVLVAIRYLPVRPFAHEVYAKASDNRRLVLQAHGGQMQAV